MGTTGVFMTDAALKTLYDDIAVLLEDLERDTVKLGYDTREIVSEEMAAIKVHLVSNEAKLIAISASLGQIIKAAGNEMDTSAIEQVAERVAQLV